MNSEMIKEGVKLILEGIGEDITREGLLERLIVLQECMRNWLAAIRMMQPNYLQKRFHVDNNDMVMERTSISIPFGRHHMLPFYGTAAIAYIPNGEVVGLSKIAHPLLRVLQSGSSSGAAYRPGSGCIYGRIKASGCDGPH